MATLDSILNFAIPALLILVAFGFVYVKFLDPWVVPLLRKFWDWLNIQSENKKFNKEIVYE